MSNKDELNSSEKAAIAIEELPQIGTLPTELLTKKELALKLKISQRKIEMDHKLPKIQWGRNVRYDWREVMEYLKGGIA